MRRHTARLRRAITRAVLVAVLLGCGACGDAGTGRPPAYPTHGRVLVGGKPADHALVILVPVEGSGTPGVRPSGRCDPDGNFRLGTYGAEDGAPAGEYAVLVRWSRPPSGPTDDPDMGPDRLNGRYLDPANPAARVTIRAGETVLEPIRIP